MIDQIMRIIAWSFYSLSLGIHPEKDWANDLKPDGVGWPLDSAEAAIAGTPLAAGLRGVLYMLKGDLDHLAKMGLANYRKSKLCNFCPADRGPGPAMLFFNFQ